MFTVIGRLLDRPEIQEYARKNLAMSMYYIQPGGEVLTDASGRQDSAYQAFVDQYYYAYRYYAIKDRYRKVLVSWWTPKLKSACYSTLVS